MIDIATKKTVDFTITAGKKMQSVPMTWGYMDTITNVITPYDATGRTLRIKVRRNPAGPIVASFTSVAGEHLGGAEGTVTITGGLVNRNVILNMSAAESAKLAGLAGTYRYDCDWFSGSADPEDFFTGTITVKDEYTT